MGTRPAHSRRWTPLALAVAHEMKKAGHGNERIAMAFDTDAHSVEEALRMAVPKPVWEKTPWKVKRRPVL